MAHNRDRIPWDCLREYTRLRKANSPSSKHAEILDTLITAINDALKQDISTEAAKYPPTSNPMDDDIIISDHAALRITPIVHQWRTDVFFAHGFGGLLEKGPRKYANWQKQLLRSRPGFYSSDYIERYWPGSSKDGVSPVDKRHAKDVSRQLCTHDIGFRCRCTLPRCERTAAAFTREPPLFESCGEFMAASAKEYFGCLVIQSLLLSGDMEPFCKMKNRQSNIYAWCKRPPCSCSYMTSLIGWDFLRESCLWAYVVLNALLVLSNPRVRNPLVNLNGYQELAVYQMLVKQTKRYDYPNRVHQDFYSREPEKPTFWDRIPLPFSAESKQAARDVLLAKGLPNEIVHQVLGFVVKRQGIQVEGDPLNLANRAPLEEYMELCWSVVVRCGVLMKWKRPETDYSEDIKGILTGLDGKLVEDGLLPVVASSET